MQHLPTYIYFIFGATVLLAIWLFYRATNHFKPLLIGWMVWIVIQSVLAIGGFYNNPGTMTSRFPVLFSVPLLFMVSCFFTAKGRAFIDRFNLSKLTILHIVRIPVELVLSLLFIHKAIPEAMTFHGRNFDIFSGMSAPFVYYFGFVNKKINRTVILVWNIICLALLINVVIMAILSLPARFQQFDFEEPNIGLGYFPFILLPACLVPMVLFSTLAAIRQLLKLEKPWR